MTTQSENSESDQRKLYFDEVYRQGDSITRNFIVGFFLLGIALSFFHGTYILVIVMGGASVIVYFLIRVFARGSLLLRLTASLLFCNFGLQYLVQMRGMAEMHFIFFIALTVLLFYEDW